MMAIEKIDRYGIKALADRVGANLVTLYRWRKAIAEGAGISDANKRKLIAATAGTDHAIQLADFYEAAPVPERQQ